MLFSLSAYLQRLCILQPKTQRDKSPRYTLKMKKRSQTNVRRLSCGYRLRGRSRHGFYGAWEWKVYWFNVNFPNWFSDFRHFNILSRRIFIKETVVSHGLLDNESEDYFWLAFFCDCVSLMERSEPPPRALGIEPSHLSCRRSIIRIWTTASAS